MNPLLLALALTGPWRALPPYEAGNPQPVINSLNDMFGDRWLELPPSRPVACDGPCAEILAMAAPVACTDINQRVTEARVSWAETRQLAFELAEALEQSIDAVPAAHARLGAAMARTRALLTHAELSPTLVVERSWKLSPEELLPGLPTGWAKDGAGFRIVRKTGRVLDDHPLDVHVSTEGEAVLVKAKMAVAPVEYCSGDISYRIEGAATFLRQTTSGTLTVPLPLTTSVALTAKGDSAPTQVLSLPGDL